MNWRFITRSNNSRRKTQRFDEVTTFRIGYIRWEGDESQRISHLIKRMYAAHGDIFGARVGPGLHEAW